MLLLVGAYISGRLSDKEVIKRRKARGGEWCPEDRLRVALVGALVYAPLSILLSGIVTDYVPGTTGIVLNLFFLFINGLGVSNNVAVFSSLLGDSHGWLLVIGRFCVESFGRV